LAIVDDIGAIFVLAFAYNHGLHWPALGATAFLLLVLIGFNRARVYALWPYLTVGLLLWLTVYFSGLHATLAGVLLAATIPTREKAALDPLLAQFAVDVHQARRRVRDDEGYESEELHRLADRVQVIDRRLHPPAERLEHLLLPWSAYFVLPIFALANAGIAMNLQSISVLDHLSLGIILGLVLGKPLGIVAASWLAHRCGLGQKPFDASWAQVCGVGCLCGIGFTMSMFISNEAFTAVGNLESAKFAVMLASLVAAVAGTIWLAWPQERHTFSSLWLRAVPTRFRKVIPSIFGPTAAKPTGSRATTAREHGAGNGDRQTNGDPLVAQSAHGGTKYG
jgi:NhaA family Na+:H+ antiporter